MEKNVCTLEPENGQEDFRFEAIVGQCRLLATRAEHGLLDQRSFENLARASRELAETEKRKP